MKIVRNKLDKLEVNTSKDVCRCTVYNLIGYFGDGGVLTKEVFGKILEENINHVAKESEKE
ncbi:MAG TPA: hypothetical protein VIK78_19705 [Ruminiclostridium sp.]